MSEPQIAAMQREMLPAGLALLPSVLLTGAYVAAADGAAGGDWFDAVPVPGGRVALVTGDVVGHGTAASAVMGRLRAVLRDRLDEAGDLCAAVAAADRVSRWLPGAHAATVCVVLLDPADGRLTYCSAGHPPPLVAGPGGTRFLARSGDGPLGTGAARTVLGARLGHGETLLLYTDGIVERPDRSPAEAEDELCRAVSATLAGAGLDSLVTGLAPLIARTGFADDITLLAAQRRRPAPPLRLTEQATPSSITTLRTAVEAWADSVRAGDDDRLALTHAAVELVTNAYEHGRPHGGGGTVTLTAELSADGEAVVSVADEGRWRERARPGDDDFRRDHGFGLVMTASFADGLDIERTARGTTVVFRRRLSRPVRLLSAGQVGLGGAAAGDVPKLMLIVDQPNAPSNRVAIHGPLDAANVEQLSAELGRLTLGGSHDLVVDLSAVTLLGSAAVAELYRTARYGEDGHYPLRLYAPAGSAAHHVLTLVDLPHVTSDPHVCG